MARILCINDNPIQAERFAAMLRRGGAHDVAALVPPIDPETVVALAPDLIVVNLVRKVSALRSPMANFEAEVEGAQTLRALLADMPDPHPPVLVTGLAVEAWELPEDLAGAAFLEVPGQLSELLARLPGSLDQPLSRP